MGMGMGMGMGTRCRALTLRALDSHQIEDLPEDVGLVQLMVDHETCGFLGCHVRIYVDFFIS
jgi:hypothetical protein